MFQQSEIVCLALGMAFLTALYFLANQGKLPRLPILYGGVVLLFFAQVFTVAEDIAWAPVFNVLEHVCYALSGLLFAAGCWLLARRREEAQP